MRHRHHEFSLYLRWRPQGRHDAATPGFYLTAGWSNEGVSEWPIDGLRLSDDQFRSFMAVADDAALGDGSFKAAADRMLADASDAVEQRRQALIDQIDKAQRALTELDS
jgi:hypothetical protein